MLAIERARWDLIILDEGQRIKNWESKTSSSSRAWIPFAWSSPARRWKIAWTISIRSCNSSTTAACGPGFRFFNRHRMVDEKGKVLGYKNLSDLRQPCGQSCSAARATSVLLNCRRARVKSSAFRPPMSRWNCTRRHMRVVAIDHTQEVHH